MQGNFTSKINKGVYYAKLKIAYSQKVEQYFSTNRELVEIAKTDFTDVAAIVLSSGDVGEYLGRIQATKFAFQYSLFKQKNNKWIQNSMILFTISKI